MKKNSKQFKRIRALIIITFILILMTFGIIKVNNMRNDSIAQSALSQNNSEDMKLKEEAIIPTPNVNDVSDKDTRIVGKAQANSIILVKMNDKIISTSKADNEGNFVATIPIQKSGAELNINSIDEDGNKSESTKINVKHQDRTEKVLLDVPIISQLPELPRGCEVTSLSMLLKYYGVSIDKLELADKIKKDTTPYKKENNEIYFGNPNDGFVGDMYNLKNPGLGVYHKPIYDLAFDYLPNRIIDITGSSFQDVLDYISSGNPVLVINNSHFKTLPDEYWKEWNTPTGKIKITLKEHAIVITGYDQNYVYFNDPLANQKNRKVLIKDFEEGWIQMGSQAITAIQ